jgi:hypothetical protein
MDMCIRLAPKNVVVQKEGWKVAQLKGKYATHMLALLQATWLKGSRTTYVPNKLILLVMMVEEGKHIDWSIVLFYNLYSCIWDFLTLSKSKETLRKELEFGLAQVIDIILKKWFPLESKTKLPKSDPNDEDDDLVLFNSNSKMKSASLETLAQGTSIDMDSMPYVQGEGTQQSSNV